MHALSVSFDVPGKTIDEVVELMEPLVPAFRDLPGLLAKIWVADGPDNRYGGFYLWRDEEALEAFLASDLWRSVKTHPAFDDLEFRSWAVVEAFTKETQPEITIF